MFYDESGLLDGQLSNVVGGGAQETRNYAAINTENVTELSRNPANTLL